MLTYDNFREYVVAQDDDCDYSESGWLALIHEGTAYLARYGHCSCYDTLEGLGIDKNYMSSNWFVWSGSVDGLISMAERKADPAMPERIADSEDCDYDHLMTVYKDVLGKKNSLI